MKTDIDSNKKESAPKKLFSPDLSLHTGTLCTSLDVSRFSRRLVLATHKNHAQPTTQEVESGVSCYYPQPAEGVSAANVTRSISGRRTAPISIPPTSTKPQRSP